MKWVQKQDILKNKVSWYP